MDVRFCVSVTVESDIDVTVPSAMVEVVEKILITVSVSTLVVVTDEIAVVVVVTEEVVVVVVVSVTVSSIRAET